jgi:uncharacterized protein (TIGR00266 family)
MQQQDEWYVVENGQSAGPLSLDQLAARLPAAGGPQAMVYGPGLSAWTPAGQVPAVAQRLAGPPAPPRPAAFPPPPTRGQGQSQSQQQSSGGGGWGVPATSYQQSPGYQSGPGPQAGLGYQSSRPRADEIDYKVFGEEMQYVEVTLDPGEVAIAEPGGMMYMEPGIVMQTVFGDPSAQQQQGFLGKLMTAGKRMLTGESLFMSTFANQGQSRQIVAFAAPYPGKIIPVHLDREGGELICQKDSFLAAARGIQISIAFQKKIGVALFGGEGFIMQRLTGDGVALLHAGGTIMKRTLRHGETLRVDTGCIVAMHKTIHYDIQMTGGFKNSLFGGEGLFLATVTGPGDVWLQSLPFARLAGRVLANASGGGKDEGSVLGKLGGFLGDGD